MEIDSPSRLERLATAARRWGGRRASSQGGEKLTRWLEERHFGEELLKQEIEALRADKEVLVLKVGAASIMAGTFTSKSRGIDMPAVNSPLPSGSELRLKIWTTGWEKNGTAIRPVFGDEEVFVTLPDIAESLIEGGQLTAESKVENPDSLVNE